MAQADAQCFFSAHEQGLQSLALKAHGLCRFLVAYALFKAEQDGHALAFGKASQFLGKAFFLFAGLHRFFLAGGDGQIIGQGGVLLLPFYIEAEIGDDPREPGGESSPVVGAPVVGIFPYFEKSILHNVLGLFPRAQIPVGKVVKTQGMTVHEFGKGCMAAFSDGAKEFFVRCGLEGASDRAQKSPFGKVRSALAGCGLILFEGEKAGVIGHGFYGRSELKRDVRRGNRIILHKRVCTGQRKVVSFPICRSGVA